jgi:hypothetical protein
LPTKVKSDQSSAKVFCFITQSGRLWNGLLLPGRSKSFLGSTLDALLWPCLTSQLTATLLPTMMACPLIVLPLANSHCTGSDHFNLPGAGTSSSLMFIKHTASSSYFSSPVSTLFIMQRYFYNSHQINIREGRLRDDCTQKPDKPRRWSTSTFNTPSTLLQRLS